MWLTTEVFATLSLGRLLQFGVLELGEFSCVLENLDEALLIKSLGGRLCDSANSIACCLKETLFIQISRVDRWQILLLVVLGISLALLNWGILDRDSLTHLCLVDNDRFVGAKDVEGDLILTIALYRDVESGENGELVLEHLSGDGIIHNVDIGGSFVDLLFQESQNALGLEKFLNEAHVTGDLEVLVLLRGHAEHNWGSLLEVLPEFAILTLGQEVTEDALVWGGSVLWGWRGLTETVGDGEGHFDASL